MSDLSPRAQELLRTARENEVPRPGQKALIRAALTAAAPVAVGGTGAAVVKGATLTTKIVIASMVSLAVVGGSVGAWRVTRPAPVEPVETTGLVEPVEPVETPLPIELEPGPTPAPKRIVRKAPHKVAAKSEPIVTAPPILQPTVTPCSVADEIALLRQGQGALREGQPQLALQFFERHRATCSSGTLREEREAGRIIALCALKRGGEANEALRAFRLSNPRSPHLARVEQACRATP